MTDLLKDTLTAQAAGAEPPELDLDALIALGDRRIRRRRAGTLLGTAFVALAVVAAGLTAVRLTQSEPQPAAEPAIQFTERRPTYALNGVIHFGDAEIATGAAQIQQFVQTDAGFLFANQGDLRLTDGRTTREVAAVTKDSPLVASGALAGWKEQTVSGTRTVIKNVRTNKIVYEVNHPNRAHSTPPDAPTGELVAIDGTSAYFTTPGGLFQTNLDTKLGTVIRPSTAVVRSLTVVSSTYIYLAKGPEGTRTYISINRPPSQLVAQTMERYSAAPVSAGVSTSGSSIAVASGGFLRVYDSQGRLSTTIKGVRPAAFGQWLSDTSFTALDAPQPGKPVDLLTCTVPATLTVNCSVTEAAVAVSPADLTFPSN